MSEGRVLLYGIIRNNATSVSKNMSVTVQSKILYAASACMVRLQHGGG